MHPDCIIFYRWPNETDWTIVEGKRSVLDSQNNSNAKGFVLSSFDSKELEIVNVDKSESVKEFPANRIEELIRVFKPFIIGDDVFDISNYNNALKNAIDTVNSGSIKKIVISRKQLFDFNYDNFLEGFKLFSDAFPTTFTFIMFSHKHGIWFGASPEVLIEEKSESFVTMALAGTIKSESDITLSDWKQKEIEEHEYVSQYLREKLRSQNFNFLEEALTVNRSGNIHHLLKRFNIQKNNSTNLLSVAKFLHPTPAICGLPQQDSKEFILANENYKRELYTGFLGPVGLEGKSGFFVNLRCGKLVKNGLVLFAGGGINKGSVAEDELNETKNKMENSLRFFI